MYFSMLPCYNTFAKTFFALRIKFCLVLIHLKVPFGLHSAVGILGIWNCTFCKICMLLILHYLTNIQTSIPICKIKFALFVPLAPFAVFVLFAPFAHFIIFAGVVAAAGLFGLDHVYPRLGEDHVRSPFGSVMMVMIYFYDYIMARIMLGDQLIK